MHNENPHAAENLAEIIAKYSLLLIDSWGVLQNGDDILPPGKMLVDYIQNYSANVVVLTNSPERNSRVRTNILTLGLDISPDIAVISAGEIAYQDMYAHKKYRGKKAYIIDYDNYSPYFEGLPLVFVNRIEEAELLIVRSINPDISKVSSYADTIQKACAQGIPIVIINPDEAVQSGTQTFARPGSILPYCTTNTDILYYGKPWPRIYSHIEVINPTIEPSKILVIGDSLYTDVLGANLNGYDSLHLIPINHSGHDVNTGIFDYMSEDIRNNRSTLLTPTYTVRY
ncbi:MAG: TIGR01459 family HAD-type hydrolase [Alphaproteobacteria bacterium]|nr:MAG: TIGR01459 family HAD-type hydrolase [Alphaproteobacteria bacterium]